MKPWIIASLFGALFGMASRRWLSIDMGRGQTFEPSGKHVQVHVIIGLGNRVIYNADPSPLSASPQESSHAEGA